MNKQLPVSRSSDATLQVHSVFSTIQGEGPFCGERAIFVRLAGCNLQCPLCDTEYTEGATTMASGDLAAFVDRLTGTAPGYLVVITGGEPFRQDSLQTLVKTLLRYNYRVQIETNGTLYMDLPYEDERLCIVCSPKTGRINPDLLQHISALKYVLRSGHNADADGLPLTALDHPAKPRLARPPKEFPGKVYIQPADENDVEKNRRNMNAAVDVARRFGYILQLQIHKIIGVA